MKPIARKDRLIRQVVDQDTLVYDPADDTACCLNALASAVWRHCDGTRTVEEIAALVAAEVPLPSGVEAVDAVWRVVEELEQNNLLAVSADEALAVGDGGMRRRDLVKSFVAIGLFPSIQRITAPRIGNASSPLPTPTPTNSPTASTPTLSLSATPTVTPTMTQTVPLPSPSVSLSMTPTPTPSAT